MELDEAEATLNLLDWKPVVLAENNQLMYGVIRGLDFFMAVGPSSVRHIRIVNGQTAMMGDWCQFEDWQTVTLAHNAQIVQKNEADLLDMEGWSDGPE